MNCKALALVFYGFEYLFECETNNNELQGLHSSVLRVRLRGRDETNNNELQAAHGFSPGTRLEPGESNNKDDTTSLLLMLPLEYLAPEANNKEMQRSRVSGRAWCSQALERIIWSKSNEQRNAILFPAPSVSMLDYAGIKQ